jgi:hypothetical protein
MVRLITKIQTEFTQCKMSIKHVRPDSKYRGGVYHPINVDKYVGEGPIICRSSWERKYCQYCDLKDEVLKWASEPFKVKYYNPLTKKEHTYYPDFYVKAITSSGTIKEYIVEIKPSSYLKKPVQPKRNTEKAISNYKYLYESFIKNYAKAKTCKMYAADRNMEYIILTEKSLK